MLGQNTLAVTNLQDFVLGALFASVTGIAVTDGGIAGIMATGTKATRLGHESGNPVVPALYLMHFTVGDVSGATAVLPDPVNDDPLAGIFEVISNFGETTYVFTIGATVTTEPHTAALGFTTGRQYQAGVYSGAFTVTAAY